MISLNIVSKQELNIEKITINGAMISMAMMKATYYTAHNVVEEKKKWGRDTRNNKISKIKKLGNGHAEMKQQQ